MHFEENGAFTGEIAPGMLKDMGVDMLLLDIVKEDNTSMKLMKL